MIRAIVAIVSLFAVPVWAAAAPESARRAPAGSGVIEGPGEVEARVLHFYRALPASGFRAFERLENLCTTLPLESRWVEGILIDHLRDAHRTHQIRTKSLFGLACLASAGAARCPGTLVPVLLELDADATLSPDLREAVAITLARAASEDRVPRVAVSGTLYRRDYRRWWDERGRWLHSGVCRASRI